MSRLGLNFVLISLLWWPLHAYSAFSNYNSVLIGERAAGLGGAFTALSGDPAAAAYYNPASLGRMQGSSLSANVNVYNKYDTQLGELDDFSQPAQRVNRGFFRSLPASSGSVLNFDKFAIALSIIVPDYDFYSGDVRANQTTSSYLSYVDESLWVGGGMGLRLNENNYLGFTLYYTARSLIRSVSDRQTTGSTAATITTEEKNLTNNSIVYVLGYQRALPNNLYFGVSLRMPSIEVSGEGSYIRSTTTTTPYSSAQINEGKIKSETRIPMKAAIGIAHDVPKHHTHTFDISFYGSESYYDLDLREGADLIDHVSMVNAAIGYETWVKPYLAWRLGVFSNFSSHKEPDPSLRERQGDHLEMYGFASNLAFFTQDKVSFTFGGYYSGGRGRTAQRVGTTIITVPKSQQIFTMLVGTSLFF